MKLFIQQSDYEALSNKDEKIKEVIKKAGEIDEYIEPDLFKAIVKTIVSQNIPYQRAETYYQALAEKCGTVNAENIVKVQIEEIQQCGLTYRKASYIYHIAQDIQSGYLDLKRLETCDDDEVRSRLALLPGIGEWTADKLMIYSMGRRNVFSIGDRMLQKGIRMVYHHRKTDDKLMKKYQRRFSPYGTLASFYLWRVAGGLIEGYEDYQDRFKE